MCGTRGAIERRAPLPLAQESLWPKDEEHDKKRKNRYISVLDLQIGSPERLDQGNHKAAGRGQGASKRESSGDHAVYIDSDEGCHGLVLRARTLGTAERRARQQVPCRGSQNQRDEREQPLLAIDIKAEAIGLRQNKAALCNRGKPDITSALGDKYVVLQHDGEPDGGNERHQGVGVAERAKDKSLRCPAISRVDSHRDHKRQRDGRDHGADTNDRQKHQGDGTRKGADHVKLAEREIDGADDAVDERIPDRDEGYDATERQPVHELLQEVKHARTERERNCRGRRRWLDAVRTRTGLKIEREEEERHVNIG